MSEQVRFQTWMKEELEELEIALTISAAGTVLSLL